MISRWFLSQQEASENHQPWWSLGGVPGIQAGWCRGYSSWWEEHHRIYLEYRNLQYPYDSLCIFTITYWGCVNLCSPQFNKCAQSNMQNSHWYFPVFELSSTKLLGWARVLSSYGRYGESPRGTLSHYHYCQLIRLSGHHNVWGKRWCPGAFKGWERPKKSHTHCNSICSILWSQISNLWKSLAITQGFWWYLGFTGDAIFMYQTPHPQQLFGQVALNYEAMAQQWIGLPILTKVPADLALLNCHT